MTPNREQLEHDLLAYVEGNLPPDEHARIEIFLANTDPKLARQIAGALDDRLALQSIPALSAPADLSERIMAQVERQSLIGGVERQLTTEPRRWFQTRMAIAASLLIVVGGFSYYVGQSILHPANKKWTDWTTSKAGDNKETQIATADNPKKDGPLETAKGNDTPAPVQGKPNGEIAMGERKDGVVAPTVATPSPPANPATVAVMPAAPVPMDTERRLNDQLKNGRLVAIGNLDAAAAGYQAVSNSQVALDSVQATRRDGDASPVVLTLVARDSEDMNRLESILADYVGQADVSPNKAAQDSPVATPMAAPRVGGMRGGGAGGAGGGRGGAGGGFGGGGQAAAGGAASPADSSATKQQNDIRLRAMALPTPGTYHVLLKPDQLEHISQMFTISSVARGNASYSINGNSLAKTSAGSLALNGDGQNTGGNSGNLIAGQNQSQFPSLNANNGANGNTPLNNGTGNYANENTNAYAANGGVPNSIPSPTQGLQVPGATQPSASSFNKAAAPRAMQPQNAQELPWIDCVITIVPPPASTAPVPAKN